MPERVTSSADPRDTDFEELLSSVREQFAARSGPFFQTDAGNLYDLYLSKLPEDERQSHTCGSCKEFLRRYGSLVSIDPSGKLHALMWTKLDASQFYASAVAAMRSTVESAHVTGVFLSKIKTLGSPLSTAASRDWTHFSVDLSDDAILKSALSTPYQAMAEKREDHKNMTNALELFSSKSLTTAVTILKSEALYRNEKVLGAAEWLKKTHSKYNSVKNKAARENILWLEIASAPAGFCHPRSSMIGSLLEDIESGMAFAEVKSKFEAKMHPLQYQRPQAAPSAANIARGEKIFKELGAENSLKRRFARLDEIFTIWTSKALDNESKKSGIFSMLQPKPARSKAMSGIEIPPITMTWEKFKRTVLPEAELIEYYVENRKSNFSTLLTASDLTAPPILQWDSLERRNPFSWYQYHGGSLPADWNVKPDSWCNINAITITPAHWYSDKFSHHHKSILFIIDQAKDMKYKGQGIALFPEDLKAEFREIRATIELYSKTAEMEGFDQSSTSGIPFYNQAGQDFALRVTTQDSCQRYKLDRFD